MDEDSAARRVRFVAGMEVYDEGLLRELATSLSDVPAGSGFEPTWRALHVKVREIFARGVEPKVVLDHVDLLPWEDCSEAEDVTDALAEVVSFMTPYHAEGALDELVPHAYWRDRARLGLSGYS